MTAIPGRPTDNEPDFRALFQLAPSPSLLLSPDLTVVAVNDAYLRMSGENHSAMLDRALLDLLAVEPAGPMAPGRSDLRASLQRVLASGTPDRIEGILDGRAWMALNTPLLNGDGILTHILHQREQAPQTGVIRARPVLLAELDDSLSDLSEPGDIVQQACSFLGKALGGDSVVEGLALIQAVAQATTLALKRQPSENAVRLSESKFRTIADAIPQIVWSTLPDGYHDYYNQQWYDYTGMQDGSTDGEGWNGLFHPEDQEYAWERWRHSLATGEVYEIQYRLRHRSGDYRWVLGRALPIRDREGTIIRWMGTCTDIHSQKLAEDDLKEASRRKDEFLAMLAHELRNPLAPISTAAQLLKMPGVDDKRIHQASDIIARQVRHMTALVDDLLDVSRVTRGLVQLEKEELQLEVLVNSAMEQARPLFEARRHELILRMPAVQACVHGDKTRLVQAIANLLNNAAKYTPQAGTISLAVETRDNQALISVTDNGIGITAELMPHIFDLFTQAERTPDRAQGGLGLGLALVKSIVSLHGGSVEGSSAGAGKGSAFSISLPLARPGLRKTAQAAEHALAPAPALRLMIVDDNQDAALSLAAVLEGDGHQVMVFEDAASVLAAPESETAHAFILDIGLPDIDGYELARRLRVNPRMAGKILIALTGYGQAHDRVLSKAAGFDHHFVKPVDAQQLARILAHVPAQ